MLMLARKEGEAITLILTNGEAIEITLTEYRGKQTIVGIDAPQDVRIWRNELLADVAHQS